MNSIIRLSAISLIFMATTSSYGLETQTELGFSTQNQPLYRGRDLQEQAIQFHLLDEHIPETTRGEIRRLPEELPVHTLQAIWERALATCQGYEYTLKVENITLFRRSPTEAECIAGEIRQNYCVAPPKLGWSGCLDAFGNRKTWVRSVGSGIGPKPTQPATRDYDLGMELRYSMDLELGIEGHFRVDPGSVAVSLAGAAGINTDVAAAAEGEVFRIRTWFSNDDAQYRLSSTAPNVDFAVGSFIHAQADVRTEYASVNFNTGEQERGSEVNYMADSRNTTVGNSTVDGVVRFADSEWLGLNFSPAGVDIRLKEETLPLFTGGLYRTDLVVPGIRPVPGVPAFSFADLAVLTPEMNTPVAFGFDCGDCFPLREQVDVDDRIQNTIPTGTRQLLAGAHDGSDWALPFTDDGIHDSDFFRLDFDMDVMSLVWGVPLGVIWEGPKLPNKAKILGPVAAVEMNAVDVDVASFWSIDQELSFTPELAVILQFTPAVAVRTETEAQFSVRDSVTITAGESVEIVQPAGGVAINPVYTLANNQFSNRTQLNVSFAVQESLLQMRVYGLIPSLLGGSLGMPTNFVAFQLTPQLADPVSIFTTDDSPAPLGGFADLEGDGLFVGVSEADSRVIARDSAGNGSSEGGSSGGGGGGSLTWYALLLWLGVLGLQRHLPGTLRYRRPQNPAS
ncbi:MAG: hypothetical protein SV765_04815 [Pseudomonadota bacterium]|nr:hypothetical protein [Pseudomonadota bacterium]